MVPQAAASTAHDSVIKKRLMCRMLKRQRTLCSQCTEPVMGSTTRIACVDARHATLMASRTRSNRASALYWQSLRTTHATRKSSEGLSSTFRRGHRVVVAAAVADGEPRLALIRYQPSFGDKKPLPLSL
jgi:hypothetical protein